MARRSASALLPRLRQRLLAYRWRRVGVLAGASLVVGCCLVAYLFGWADHFITRFLTAFFTAFSLLAVTFLGILPFIGWATTHWFGAGWATGVDAPASSRPATAAQPATPRRSFTS